MEASREHTISELEKSLKILQAQTDKAKKTEDLLKDHPHREALMAIYQKNIDLREATLASIKGMIEEERVRGGEEVDPRITDILKRLSLESEKK